jgi:hypothetical protein
MGRIGMVGGDIEHMMMLFLINTAYVGHRGVTGFTEAWLHVYLVTRVPGYTCTWLHVYLVTRVPGYTCTWLHGPGDTATPHKQLVA